MATLDLGKVGFEISVDTAALDKGLADAKASVEQVDKALEKAGRKKLAPTTDTRQVDRLGTSIEKADKAADKVSGRKVAPAADTRQVERLASELDKADKAADRIELPSGFTPSLSAAADKARQLKEALSANLSREGLAGQITSVAGAAKGLVPALGAASVATSAFIKGWGRLTSIQNAQATLKGLGNDAEAVSAVMGNALTAVKGTAFGLGDAAKTAASAVASGVQPGKQLEQVLTTIADTAAISGDNIADVGLIFNSVLARGKLQGDDMLQLMSRGIPVLQTVADHLGITAQEASDMASEGAISFEIFEEAMRNKVGGAAQEMGQTVQGAMANTGAALGRFGATLLSPAFKGFPIVLGGITDGLDMMEAAVKPAANALTGLVEVAGKGLEALGKGWSALPNSVQTTIVAVGAARVALALLNRQFAEQGGAMSVMRAQLTTVSASLSSFKANVITTTGALQAANPGMTTFGAGLRAIATQSGVASASMGLLRTTATGLLGLVGGPAGVAVMALGAGIGALVGHFQRQRQAAEDSRQAVESWAEALGASAGRVDDSIRAQAVAAVQAEELGDAFKKTGHSAGELAAAITDDGAYRKLIATLDEQIAKTEEVSWADAEAHAKAYERKEALEALRSSAERLHGEYSEGAEKAREAADAQAEAAAQTEAAGAAADASRGTWESLNSTFRGIADEAKSVDDVIKNLATNMAGLSDDPAIRLQAYTDDMHSALSDLKKTFEGGALELNLDTGTWTQGTEQAIKLNAEMRDFKQTLELTAAAEYELNREMGKSHVEAAEAARDVARQRAEDLRNTAAAANMSADEVNKLVETYASVPDEVFTNLTVAGIETADELVKGIKWELATINEDGTVITMDSSALDLTEEQLSRLKLEKEDIGNGTIELHVKDDAESTLAALQELQLRADKLGMGTTIELRADLDQLTADLNEVQGIKAHFETDPATLGVVADSEKARAELDKLKIDYSQIDGNLYIQDNSDEVREALKGIGVEVQALPEGHITIEDNTGVVKRALDELGVKTTSLPDGQLLVESNVDEVRAALADLKRWTEAYGDQQVIEFLANTDDFDMKAQDVAAMLNELDQFQAKPLTDLDVQKFLDKGMTVQETLLELGSQEAVPLADLDPAKFNKGRDAVNKDLKAIDRSKTTAKIEANDKPARGVIESFTRWVANKFSIPFVARVAARQGHADGGLVGLATGGVPYGTRGGGYKLPNAGPGTGVTDGILGVDQRGEPTAWVDRGEFVVNRGSTRDFEPTLWAINRGDAVGAMRTLAHKIDGMDVGVVPRYAEGGLVSASDLLAFASGRNVGGQKAPRSLEGAPYVWGGGLLGNWGDCSGAMSGLAAFATGAPLQGRKFATMNEGPVLARMGARSGLGSGPRLAIGWFNGGPAGGHTSGTIYSADGSAVNVEMGGGRGNGQIGGRAAGAGHPQYTNHAYIPLAGNDVGLGDGASFESTSVDGVTVSKGTQKFTVDWGEAGQLAAAFQENAHRAEALSRYRTGQFADGGVVEALVYDRGGILPPGGIAVNMGKRPEAVLDPNETTDYKRGRVNPQVDAAIIKLGEYVPAIAQEYPKVREAYPRLVESANNLSGWAARVVDTAARGDKAGLVDLGWEQTQAANANLRALAPDASQFERWALHTNRAAGEALMGAASMTSMQWAQAGEKLGLSFVGEYVTPMLTANEKLEDTYVAQVDAADALKEAQENVTKAQQQLNEALGDTPELSTQKQRQLEDAERKLAEAKAAPRAKGDKDGTAQAKKIADAERNLARVREDAAKDLEKAGARSGEEVLAAREALKSAEADLTTAQGVIKSAAAATGQAQIAMALEAFAVIRKAAKAMFDFVDKIVDRVNRAKVGFSEAIATATDSMRELVAATEQQREAVQQIRIQAAEMAMEVGRKTFSLRQAQIGVMKAQLEGVRDVRKAEANLRNERLRSVEDQGRVYDFDDLSIEYDKYINSTRMNLAEDWSYRTYVEHDAIATTTGVVVDNYQERLAQFQYLTDEEKRLVEEVFSAKFKGLDLEKAALEEQLRFTVAYNTAAKLGMEDLLQTQYRVTPEILAMADLVNEAEWRRQERVLAATLTALDAAYEQAEATKSLHRLTDDLHVAIVRAQRQAASGFDERESTIHAELAKSEARIAAAQADRKNAGNVISRAFDWNGDGRTLFFDNKGSQKHIAAQATIEAETAYRDELLKRLGNGVPVQLSEKDRKTYELAGRLYANGEKERADGLIATTTHGRAAQDLRLNEFDSKLDAIADRQLAAKRREEDLWDKFGYEMLRQPREYERASAGMMADSYAFMADAKRSSTHAEALANTDLSTFSRNMAGMLQAEAATASRDLAERVGKIMAASPEANKRVQKIQVDLAQNALYHSEDVANALNQVIGRIEGVEIDVRQVQRELTAGQTRNAVYSRAGIVGV